jgi:thiamine biosynthesis lipoprotein
MIAMTRLPHPGWTGDLRHDAATLAAGGRTVHHIVDPRTGEVATSCWRTATVAAASCVAANTASTAAVVMGPAAVAWLAGCGLAARLVAEDGVVTEVAGWPTARTS